MKREITFKADPGRPVLDISLVTVDEIDCGKWSALFHKEVQRIQENVRAQGLDDFLLRGALHWDGPVVCALLGSWPFLMLGVTDKFSVQDSPADCAWKLFKLWNQAYQAPARPMDVRPWRSKGDA